MKSLRELIVRLAKENAGWGVRRIVGELKKLAVKTSRSIMASLKFAVSSRQPSRMPVSWQLNPFGLI
jgi:hypothetical protein